MTIQWSTTSPRHSMLIHINGDVREVFRRDELHELLQSGVKVYLLLDVIPDKWLQQYEPYMGELFFFHTGKTNQKDSNLLVILDGKMSETEKHALVSIAAGFPDFNLEQYLVEHAPIDEHLAVMAGAGTGKTTVMMQRILFLLHTTNVELDQVVLLTFTKDAAQHMFHKLRDVFHTRYKLTGKRLYLKGMELAGNMRISTISSFAKLLLTELGSVLGFGQDVQIRSFVMERKVLIEKYLNEHWAEQLGNNTIATRLSGYRMYELVDQISYFWGEMEKKGFIEEDLSQMVWGDTDRSSKHFNNLFQHFFRVCEPRFQKIKQDSNAISLNDLTRQIDLISRQNVPFEKLRLKIGYLFIDEFQDTDEVQIRLAIVLQQAFQAVLFVVGDIKQSIYRFRGANETAFRTLGDGLQGCGQQLNILSLKKNYRTDRAVLDRLNTYFREWGKAEHIVYQEDDRLQGMKTGGNPDDLVIDRVYLTRDSNLLKEKILDYIVSERNLQTHDVTVLTRTNKEAHLIKLWCDEAGIYARLVVQGGFFVTEAVRDFHILIGALLYPQDPVWQISLRNTPYSDQPVAWSALAGLNGSSQAVLKLLQEHWPYRGWEEHVRKLATQPIMSVIRQIIETTRPVERFYHEQLNRQSQNQSNPVVCERDAYLESLQYRKNLNHLLDLIHQRFDSDFVTLYMIHRWLAINISTNREEDEPIVSKGEDESQRLEIRTVHKAKGLEFDTVIIPFTDRRFWRPNNEILFRKGTPIEAGWVLQRDSKAPTYRNDLYADLSPGEWEELFNEETRLLYVAMTRCKKRLVVVHNTRYNYSKKTWSYLLTYKERGNID